MSERFVTELLGSGSALAVFAGPKSTSLTFCWRGRTAPRELGNALVNLLGGKIEGWQTMNGISESCREGLPLPGTI